MLLRLVVALAALSVIACAGPAIAVSPAGTTPGIVTIRLPFSNAHLIRSAQPVLVDAGRPADCAALREALRQQGVAGGTPALVVLTHGHSDHSGCAAEMQSRGAKVVLGRGDLVMAETGNHGNLTPTSAFAHLLKLFAISPELPRFAPDFTVDPSAPLDLKPWGVAGRVRAMPGHTAGSLVVVLDAGEAFVGDQVLGGWFGGAFFADRPGRHCFHADEAANDRNIGALLAETAPRIETFRLGHGGPVARAAVAEAFPRR